MTILYANCCRNGTQCDTDVARMFADTELTGPDTGAFNTVYLHSTGQFSSGQLLTVHTVYLHSTGQFSSGQLLTVHAV